MKVQVKRKVMKEVEKLIDDPRSRKTRICQERTNRKSIHLKDAFRQKKHLLKKYSSKEY